MHDVIDRLRVRSGLEITDMAESWEIRILKPDHLEFKISVPREVLEWFVTARRASTGQELWSDWMDYYEVNGETETELRREMERDIKRFLERLLTSTFRVVESRRFFVGRQRLEWLTGEGWERVSF